MREPVSRELSERENPVERAGIRQVAYTLSQTNVFATSQCTLRTSRLWWRGQTRPRVRRGSAAFHYRVPTIPAQEKSHACPNQHPGGADLPTQSHAQTEQAAHVATHPGQGGHHPLQAPSDPPDHDGLDELASAPVHRR